MGWMQLFVSIPARIHTNRTERSLMSGNAAFTYTDTALISVAHVDAPEVVTSDSFDEKLAATYERVGAQAGLLESLAGVKERRWWPEGHLFTDAAAAAGEKAIAFTLLTKS